MQQLTDLYKSILQSIGMCINEHGVVEMDDGDVVRPCLVSNRKLILPTHDVLRHYNPEHQIAFHPLSESVVRGQSPVIKKLRLLTMFRIQVSLQDLMEELMQIAADTSKHSKLPPAGVEMLRAVPDADAKTVEALSAVLDKIDGEDNKLVSFYLRQGGTVEGKVVQRATIVTFPITKEFDNVEYQMFGVKMRKKDRVAITALFNWILPGWEHTDTYSFGSNSPTAPYFHALINAYAKVGKRINDVAKHFKKLLPPGIMLDLDFAKDVVDINQYRDLLPVLSGNDGELTNESSVAKTSLINDPPPMAVATPVAAPVHHAPVAVTTPQTITINTGTQAGVAIATDQYSHIKSLGATGKAAAEVVRLNNQSSNFDPVQADWEQAVMRANMPQIPSYLGMTPGAPVMPPIHMPWLPNHQQPQLSPQQLYQMQMMQQAQQLQQQQQQQFGGFGGGSTFVNTGMNGGV